MKQDFHQLVLAQLPVPLPDKLSKFTVNYVLYYKNPSSDGSNIISRIEKFTLDALQEAGCIVNDNVLCHLGSQFSVGGQDKDNPRVEIFIEGIQ